MRLKGFRIAVFCLLAMVWKSMRAWWLASTRVITTLTSTAFVREAFEYACFRFG